MGIYNKKITVKKTIPAGHNVSRKAVSALNTNQESVDSIVKIKNEMAVSRRSRNQEKLARLTNNKKKMSLLVSGDEEHLKLNASKHSKTVEVYGHLMDKETSEEETIRLSQSSFSPKKVGT